MDNSILPVLCPKWKKTRLQPWLIRNKICSILKDIWKNNESRRFFGGLRHFQKEIEDEPRSGRPSVSKTAENVVRFRYLVRPDRRLTVRMIGEELILDHTTVHQILTNELKIRKICAKMVPKNLSQ
ncbi:uncharacterized protein TNCV_1476741 [Trichonephila clavipes]|nr:uncharacterized protein TNCV_1476741 [Trichonephila clavipes]